MLAYPVTVWHIGCMETQTGVTGMARTKYEVSYGKNRTARFSDYVDAMFFAKDKSGIVLGLVEVYAKDGIVGQFQDM